MKKLKWIGILVLITISFTTCDLFFPIRKDEKTIKHIEALKTDINETIVKIMPEISSEIEVILNEASEEDLIEINQSLTELELLIIQQQEEAESRDEIKSKGITREEGIDEEESDIVYSNILNLVYDTFGTGDGAINQFLDLGLGYSREFLESLGLSAGGAAGVGLDIGFESVGGRGEAIDFRNFARYTYNTNSTAFNGSVILGGIAGISFEVSGILSESLIWDFRQSQDYENSTFVGGGISGGISGKVGIGLGLSASITYSQGIASTWDSEEDSTDIEPTGEEYGEKAGTVAVKVTGSTGAEAGIAGNFGITGVCGNNRPIPETVYYYIDSENPSRVDYFKAGIEMSKDVLSCHNLPPTGTLLCGSSYLLALFYGTFYDPQNFDDDTSQRYSITYYSNGADEGAVPRDYSLYEKDSTAIVLENTGELLKDGYHFCGWSISNENYDTVYSPSETILVNETNITLYAIWTSNNETDTTPPSEVSNLSAISGDQQVTLYWQIPDDSDFDHVEISYGIDNTDTVFEGTIIESLTGDYSHQVTISELTNDTEYTFQIQTVDTSSNKSEGLTILKIPEIINDDIDFSNTTKLELIPIDCTPTDAPYFLKTVKYNSTIQSMYTTIDSYNIGKYEVTIELWNKVMNWAIDNGYIFDNQGTSLTETNGENSIGNISWRDAIVWCNAYSEVLSLTPIYSYNSSILKNSTSGNCDKAKVDWEGNGFRLPTHAEWQYAASERGILTYDTVLGKENNLGIIDLCGNKQELCWDMNGAFPTNTSQTSPYDNYRGTKSSYRIVKDLKLTNFSRMIGIQYDQTASLSRIERGFRVAQSN